MPIERLAMVYNADGSLAGELTYIARKLVGRGDCPLCDITHGVTGQKRAWRECVARLPVPVDALHRDELDDEQRRAIAGRLPCVIARDAGTWRVIVERAALERCAGEVGCLERLLADAVA